MRFIIEHVLRGIAVDRQKRIAALGEELAELERQEVKLAERAWRLAPSVKEVVQTFAARVGNLDAIYAEDFAVLRDEVYSVQRDAPKRWELDKVRGTIRNRVSLLAKLEGEAAGSSSPLEEFLRIMVEAGNPTISQYAVEQAGFKGHKLAAYVVSYAQSKKES